jgi:hypothetical protein
VQQASSTISDEKVDACISSAYNPPSNATSRFAEFLLGIIPKGSSMAAQGALTPPWLLGKVCLCILDFEKHIISREFW